MQRENNYNEYYYNRKPAGFSDKYILFWHRRMFDLVSRSIKDFSKKSLLEVGVGFGYFCRICKEKGMHHYIGLEMNENLADDLSKQGFNIICSEIPPFPDTNVKVDIIWMSHILEHASDYLCARKMLQSAYDKLCNGGYIVIICPDLISWGSYFYDLDWSHGFPTTRRRINQILNDVGFNIILSKHHVATITNGFLSTLLYLLFKLMPVKILDWITYKLFKKTFCSSFMSMFGWRQIVVIAHKS